MAKPNYSYEKRQRELQKKQKKAEKAQRKASHTEPAAGDDQSPDDSPAPAEAETPPAE